MANEKQLRSPKTWVLGTLPWITSRLSGARDESVVAKSRRGACPLRLALLLLALPAAASAQQEEKPGESFVDRVDVTAVELMIDVRDKKGLRVLGLGPDDFEVLEDGTPMVVLGVDYPPPPDIPRSMVGTLEPAAPALPAGGEAATPRQDRWRFLVYVDQLLTRRRSLRRVVKTLAGQADDLVALGPVEVVVADPRPRVILPFSRDAGGVREALASLEERAGGHELVRIRREFLRHMDLRWQRSESGGDTAAVLNLVRGSISQEYVVLRQRLLTLAQWIAAYGHVPASAAILVSDGFDLSLTDFYVAATSRPEIEMELSQELNRYRVDPLIEELAREIAAHGWTSVMMALGGSPLDAADASLASYDRFRSIAESSDLRAAAGAPPVSTLERPVEPLKLVAEETGGVVTTARRTARAALERIGERMRLSYQATRPSDGRMHLIEVRLRRRDLKLLAPRRVRSPTPGQIAGARARRLLVSNLDAGDLPVRLSLVELDAGGGRSSRHTEVETVFDLNLLRPVLEAPKVPFSFTFGVELADSPPVIHRVTQAVTLPSGDTTTTWPRFSYKIVLALPDSIRRISVVVEEPASGIWGGSVAGPGDS